MSKKPSYDVLHDDSYELMIAEEELILHAQMLIQRVLNERGISQKKLADKLGVRESYVSQMLGLSPRNLTLRTIARVLRALDAKATLVLDDHVDASVGGDVASTAMVGAENEAKAVASRIATSGLSEVWGEVVLLEPRKRGKRRSDDAQAYASFEPPVQEMVSPEMALAA